MKARVLVAAGLAALPHLAAADTCADLRGLMDAARSGFADGTPAPMADAASRCDLSSIAGGGKTYLCHWDFDYRAPEAVQAFDALHQDIRSCLSDAAPLAQAERVNHPDTYDQHVFALDDIEISAALKDKAALSKTLVFLRVETR